MKELVIILPGAYASTLSTPNGWPIWINPLALIGEGVKQLALSNRLIAGNPPFHYMDCLHNILNIDGFDTIFFPYDWRQDVDITGNIFQSFIVAQNASYSHIHIVTHSLGSMVARRALQNINDQNIIESLIMLGPCTKGTFTGAMAIGDDLAEIPMANWFNVRNEYLQGVLAGFPALYQVMPWDAQSFPSLQQSASDITSDNFWSGIPIDQQIFKNTYPPESGAWASTIDTGIYNDKTYLILGNPSNNATCGGVQNLNGSIRSLPQYNLPGDQFIPHVGSMIDGVKTYYANGVNHLELPVAGSVINAVVVILNGKTPSLPTQI